MGYALRCDGSQHVDVAGVDTRSDGDIDQKAGKVELDALVKELGELQELLYAAGTDALLIVLQGMDTSGKDGTIRAVLSDMNVSGIHVWSFKVPTAEERAHDFLWRHHLHTPALSSVAVFNRSYYEAVLVEVVKGIVTPEVAVSRYPHINDFELLLDQSRTVVVKFFLHISKEKQEERLLARQEEVEKWWKLSLDDWQERQRWDDYMAAYQAAINATATTWAPWYVIPSDRKWYRNLAVAQVLAETLRPHRDDWMAALRERGEKELAQLRDAGYAATVTSG
ncbi:MAG TPA: PPK2 family polyphosphate kinase [Thermomicrobiales bacterium]|jgi:PPK2 family polyphosphate:nucleotide phosphotransferase|nr:PPK2 family polyphosphate kinase [Thermomicrobiales bacterium]